MSADPSNSLFNRYSETSDPLQLFSRSAAVRRCQHTDWDLCESIRLQELQEARERASQMEKTMRWWSTCTATWREKWSQVRDERNRAREEAAGMRDAYRDAMARANKIEGEKQSIERELGKIQTVRDRESALSGHLSLLEDISIDRMEASCEARPESFHAQTQTDGDSFVDDPRCPSKNQRSSAFNRERNYLEDKLNSVQDELNESKRMLKAMEDVKNALQDEIRELRPSNSNNKQDQLDEVKSQLAVALEELRILKSHGGADDDDPDTEARDIIRYVNGVQPKEDKDDVTTEIEDGIIPKTVIVRPHQRVMPLASSTPIGSPTPEPTIDHEPESRSSRREGAKSSHGSSLSLPGSSRVSQRLEQLSPGSSRHSPGDYTSPSRLSHRHDLPTTEVEGSSLFQLSGHAGSPQNSPEARTSPSDSSSSSVSPDAQFTFSLRPRDQVLPIESPAPAVYLESIENASYSDNDDYEC